MRSQRRAPLTATITRPRLNGAPVVQTVAGAQFDADLPTADFSQQAALLHRQSGNINLPGLHTFGDNDRIVLCGTEWEILGKASVWRDRTHVRVQEAGQLLHCSIRRAGATKGEFNAATGAYPSTPHAPHFVGIARAQRASTEARTLVVAEDDVTTTAYVVALTEAPDQTSVGDVVTLAALDETGGPGTPSVELIVKALDRPSLTWGHELICTDQL